MLLSVLPIVIRRFAANARLIALAPELLTFVQEIALGAYRPEHAYMRARKLIAKATTNAVEMPPCAGEVGDDG